MAKSYADAERFIDHASVVDDKCIDADHANNRWIRDECIVDTLFRSTIGE